MVDKGRLLLPFVCWSYFVAAVKPPPAESLSVLLFIRRGEFIRKCSFFLLLYRIMEKTP